MLSREHGLTVGGGVVQILSQEAEGAQSGDQVVERRGGGVSPPGVVLEEVVLCGVLGERLVVRATSQYAVDDVVDLVRGGRRQRIEAARRTRKYVKRFL